MEYGIVYLLTNPVISFQKTQQRYMSHPLCKKKSLRILGLEDYIIGADNENPWIPWSLDFITILYWKNKESRY